MVRKGKQVQVEIFGQLYTVRAGSDASHIERLARFVDEEMRAVSRDSTTVDSLKIAVLAALNIADELHRLREGAGGESDRLEQRAQALTAQLDEALKDV